MKPIFHIQKGSLTSDKNEAIIDYDEKFGFKEIEGVHTKEEDLKNTNPKYSTGQEEYCKNCQRCVNTYEARRRGYDVEALPRILDGTDKLPHMKDKKNGWTAVYKNPMLIHCGADTQDEMVDNVDEVIKSFGVNSRAIIRVQWLSLIHI